MKELRESISREHLVGGLRERLVQFRESIS